MRTASIIENSLKEGRGFLLEYEAEEILAEYGLDVAPALLARNPEEAVSFASEVGWPVVLKVMSPRIIHKTEAGVVMVGIGGVEELCRAWEKLIKNAAAYDSAAEIKGVLVQKMIPGGKEVIVGASRDPQFGPLVMFGLGGIFVEVLNDVVFRAAPVSEKEAERMIGEIRFLKLLKGFRGDEPADIPALASAVSRISKLVTDFPRISELDANPIKADSKKAWVVDARIILS